MFLTHCNLAAVDDVEAGGRSIVGRGAVETVDGLGGCGGVRDGKDGGGVVDGSAIEDDASLVLLVNDVLDELR